MFKFMFGFLVLATSGAFAAPSTCYDLLIRSPQRSYNCELMASSAPLGPVTLEFDADSSSGPGFNMQFFGADYKCSCDSKGNFNKPSFFTSKEFTCVRGYGGPAALATVIKGKVAGKDGSKIVKVQGLATSETAPEALIGTCALSQ